MVRAVARALGLPRKREGGERVAVKAPDPSRVAARAATLARDRLGPPLERAMTAGCVLHPLRQGRYVRHTVRLRP